MAQKLFGMSSVSAVRNGSTICQQSGQCLTAMFTLSPRLNLLSTRSATRRRQVSSVFVILHQARNQVIEPHRKFSKTSLVVRYNNNKLQSLCPTRKISAGCGPGLHAYVEEKAIRGQWRTKGERKMNKQNSCG